MKTLSESEVYQWTNQLRSGDAKLKKRALEKLSGQARIDEEKEQARQEQCWANFFDVHRTLFNVEANRVILQNWLTANDLPVDAENIELAHLANFGQLASHAVEATPAPPKPKPVETPAQIKSKLLSMSKEQLRARIRAEHSRKQKPLQLDLTKQQIIQMDPDRYRELIRRGYKTEID